MSASPFDENASLSAATASATSSLAGFAVTMIGAETAPPGALGAAPYGSPQ